MVNECCAPRHAGSQTGVQLGAQDRCCFVTQTHLKKQRYTLRCVPCALQEGTEHSTQKPAASRAWGRFLGTEKHRCRGLKCQRGRKDLLDTAGKHRRKEASVPGLLLETKCKLLGSISSLSGSASDSQDCYCNDDSCHTLDWAPEIFQTSDHTLVASGPAGELYVAKMVSFFQKLIEI